MSMQVDSELVALARAGDKVAFGQLIERYQPMALRIALGMVADMELARELTQEAMLEAYLSLKHLRDDARFKSWLYGIVLNVCKSYRRNQHINFFSLEALAGGLSLDALPFTSLSPDPQELVEERELHRIVLDSVNTLSSKDRDATLLFYYNQLSLQEIAAILGISVVAVKGRLHKSRQQLKEKLLPLYGDKQHMIPVERKEKAMIRVTIADVVKWTKTDAGGQPRTWDIAILYDETARRFLPIGMGEWEGQSIAVRLNEYTFPRPMTFNFMANILEAVGVELEAVRIQKLVGNTFYATALIRSGDTVHEVDARPSDSIALALHTGSPVHVAEEVMENAGVVIPAELGNEPPFGTSAASFLKEIRETWQKPTTQAQANPAPTQEEIEKRNQEVIALVFGAET